MTEQLFKHIKENNLSLVKKDILILSKNLSSFNDFVNTQTLEFINISIESSIGKDILSHYSKYYIKKDDVLFKFTSLMMPNKNISTQFIIDVIDLSTASILKSEYWHKNMRIRPSSTNNLISQLLKKEDSLCFFKKYNLIELLDMNHTTRLLFVIEQQLNKEILKELYDSNKEKIIDTFVINFNYYIEFDMKPSFLENQFLSIYSDMSNNEKNNFRKKILTLSPTCNDKRFYLFYDKLLLIDLYNKLKKTETKSSINKNSKI